MPKADVASAWLRFDTHVDASWTETRRSNQLLEDLT
jgi:hypothetical protein